MRSAFVASLTAVALASLVVGATGGAPARKPPARSPADRAASAAVAATRGGRAAKVEKETEKGAAWEVEVALPDGRSRDVLLDSRLRVLAVSEARDPLEARAESMAGGAPTWPAGIGREAHRAVQAAARAVGGGMMLDVDREPEKGAAWEVEFMKLDGKRVSVIEDAKLHVIRVVRGKKG